MDVQLELGGTTQEVTVAANAAVLKTDKSDVHTDLATYETGNLPLTSQVTPTRFGTTAFDGVQSRSTAR